MQEIATVAITSKLSNLEDPEPPEDDIEEAVLVENDDE